MHKTAISILSICLAFFLLSCNKAGDNLTNSISPKGAVPHSLAKTQWFSSPEEWWTTTIYDGPMFYSYTASVEDYSFSYFTIRNYDFSFHWSRGGWAISMNVNGTYVRSFDVFNQPAVENGRSWWTDWTSFTYNGVNMQIRFFILHDIVYYKSNSQPGSVWQPFSVEVKVQETYIEPPQGFAVSPAEHSNFSQVVTLSWTPSTDGDVTGYEIYRRRFYVGSNGLIKFTGFALVKTFSSRTASSWQDSPLWSTNSHGGLKYEYEIRSTSSTLGMQSAFSSVRSCVESAYWNYLP